MSAKSHWVPLVVLIALLLLIQPESGSDRGFLAPDPSDAAAVQVRTLVFPVAGGTADDFTDTWGACRDGCSREHVGVDIFAPKLTPLVAAADGVVAAERRNASQKTGNKIVVTDAEGWEYHYYHLNNDTPGTDDNANPQSWIMAPGLRAGDEVRAGQLIGYVGDSGNAEHTDPHLHFEVHPPGSGPINPTPSVTSAIGQGKVVPAEGFMATSDQRLDWDDLVTGHFQQLLDRAPTEAELVEWTNRFALGTAAEADLVADLAMSADYRRPEGVALRTYLVVFGHLPTDDELDALAQVYRSGEEPTAVAEQILGSAEFGSTHGEIDDTAFTRLVTEQALGPDGPLAEARREISGHARADAVALLAESDDVKLQTWYTFQVTRAYRAGAGRLPDNDEMAAGAAYLEQGGLMVDLVAAALDNRPLDQPPRHANSFGPSELGFQPGLTVREGPVDLGPATGDGTTFGSRPIEDPEVDFELAVEEGEGGADTAHLTMRIPLEELAAAEAGAAEITVELSLTQSDDPDEQPKANASVDLSIDEGSGSSDADPEPVTTTTVRTTTTRPPATTKRPTPTTPPAPKAAPTTTTTAPAPSPTPATAPPVTEPDDTPPTTPPPTTMPPDTPPPTSPPPDTDSTPVPPDQPEAPDPEPSPVCDPSVADDAAPPADADPPDPDPTDADAIPPPDDPAPPDPEAPPEGATPPCPDPTDSSDPIDSTDTSEPVETPTSTSEPVETSDPSEPVDTSAPSSTTTTASVTTTATTSLPSE